MTASHNVTAETQMYMLHLSFDVDYGIGGGLPNAVVNINRFNVVCWKLPPRVIHLSFCWRNLKLPLHISSITETNTTCIHRRLFHNFFSIPLIITHIMSGMVKILWNKRLCLHRLYESTCTRICKYIENFISCLIFFFTFLYDFFPVKYLDIFV